MRTKLDCALCATVAFFVVAIGSACGRSALLLDDGQNGSASGGDAAGDEGDASTSIDADIGDSADREDVEANAQAGDGGLCAHQYFCTAIGDMCTNACGFPCVCADFGRTQPQWNCLRVPTGTPCVPTVDTAICIYPGLTHDDTTSCACASPAGEPFWDCGPDESLCASATVADGLPCASLPAGLTCTDANGYACQCVKSGTKQWSCPN